MSVVSGGDLVAELTQVSAPSTSGFSVRDIPSAAGYKIGRGADGVIALLTPPDSQPEPPTKLRTLRLAPQVRVRMEDPDGSSSVADHGLVELQLEDDEMLEPF